MNGKRRDSCLGPDQTTEVTKQPRAQLTSASVESCCAFTVGETVESDDAAEVLHLIALARKLVGLSKSAPMLYRRESVEIKLTK